MQDEGLLPAGTCTGALTNHPAQPIRTGSNSPPSAEGSLAEMQRPEYMQKTNSVLQLGRCLQTRARAAHLTASTSDLQGEQIMRTHSAQQFRFPLPIQFWERGPESLWNM